MAFKIILKKLKAIKTNKCRVKENHKIETEKIWTGISHGQHNVERDAKTDGCIHVHSELVGAQEFWLFGVYDNQMAKGITEYLDSHLLNKDLLGHQNSHGAKKTIKKAYKYSKPNIQDPHMAKLFRGSSSLFVMNRKKFVAASIGEYKAVLCRNGKALQLGVKNKCKSKRIWSIPYIWNMKCLSINEDDNHYKRSARVMLKKVDTKTEFIILASNGVWEVMGISEAVDLVYHIEDPQKAAELLAEEAINRMSKLPISCIVVRFH